MEDQLITFETAKLAKEKGFDLECTNHFEKDGKKMGSWTAGKFKNSDWRKELERCVRPTQSLLQCWLREEHEIYILPYYANDSWGFSIKKESIDYGFDSYEEALEKGLQEGLKLIK